MRYPWSKQTPRPEIQRGFHITAPFVVTMTLILILVVSGILLGLVTLQNQTRANLIHIFADNYASFFSQQASRLVGEIEDPSRWREQVDSIAKTLIKRSPVSGVSGIVITDMNDKTLGVAPFDSQCKPKISDSRRPIIYNNNQIAYLDVCADLGEDRASWKWLDLLTIGALTARVGADYGVLVSSQFERLIQNLDDDEDWDLALGPISYYVSNLMRLHGVQSIAVFNRAGDLVVWEQSSASLTPVLTSQTPLFHRGQFRGRVIVEVDFPEIREVERKFRFFLFFGTALAGLLLLAFPTFIVRLLEKMARKTYAELQTSHLQLQDAQLQLVNSAKMAALGTMASGIAHEVNNPLTIIIGNAEALKSERLGRSPELLEISSRISKTAFRIAKIVKSLRTLSRDGRNDPFVSSSVKSLVHEVFEFSQERLTRAGAELRVGTIAEHLEIECQPTQIEQVLLNLINNSCDAIEALDSKWIQVEVVEHNDAIAIEVTDSGRGLPQAAREKLFTPFVTTKPLGKGTGLGLSISRQIVMSHGGSLEFDAACANTRFIVRLRKKQSLARAA